MWPERSEGINLKKNMAPSLKEKLTLRMAGLCARSEQCSADIYTKLCRGGLTADEAREVLEKLKERRFIDDSRFAAAFARDKVRFAGWGPRKVQAALMAKRIPSTLIREALDSLEAADIEEALMKAAHAKARSLDLAERTDARKLLQHLASRGFSPDHCMRALRFLSQR